MNPYYRFNQEIKYKLKQIPKKNRFKFQCDLLKLIEFAGKDDYENFNLE